MVISCVNQKGGVGKTTTVLNLSSILAKKGYRVLSIDLDPQCNLTSGLGFNRNQNYISTYDVIIEDKEITEAFVISDIINNLHLVPSSIDLAAADLELVSKLSREKILFNKIAKIKNNYHYIFIDCPPSLSILTINALVASEFVIIPVQCEYYALEGISQLINTLNLIKKNLNSNLEILGVILTMFDSRTKLSNEVVDEVRNYFGNKVFETIIPRNVKLSESPSFGQPIDLYDASSSGAKAYAQLAEEIISRAKPYV